MKKSLTIIPVQTSLYRQGEDLVEFIFNSIPKEEWQEGLVLAITSKIVSLAEGRLVPADSISKKELMQKEADIFLGEIGHGVTLTVKSHLLLAGAGIDESNSENGDYILYPVDPFKSVEFIRIGLQARTGLKNLGVILTDSKTGPLRLGVTGVAISFAGFSPLKNMIGEKDLFGRPLKMTKINLVDSLASAAVLMMGEAAERCPLALIKNAPVDFCDHPQKSDLLVSPEEDMYFPLYQHLIK